MSDLYNKIKELEAKYDIQEPKKLDPLVKLKLTFPNAFKHTEEFLSEFSSIGFTFHNKNYDSVSYYSVVMETSLAEKLRKVIDKKVSSEFNHFKLNENFQNAINKYENNVTTYIDHNYQNPPDQKMFNFYSKSFDMEKRMLNENFKEEFCNEMVYVLKDCLNYDNLKPKFKTNDPLKSLVFEIYTTFEKLYYKNKIELHSMHYPYMYMFDGNDYKTFKYLEDKKYNLDLEKHVINSLNNKFDGLKSIKNNKDFNEMKNFNADLDIHQCSEESHVNSYLSKSYLKDSYKDFVTALVGVIYKAAIEEISIKQTKQVHDILVKENEPDLISNALKDYLSDAFDLQSNDKIKELISGSNPLYKSPTNKKNVKSSI